MLMLPSGKLYVIFYLGPGLPSLICNYNTSPKSINVEVGESECRFIKLPDAEHKTCYTKFILYHIFPFIQILASEGSACILVLGLSALQVGKNDSFLKD